MAIENDTAEAWWLVDAKGEDPSSAIIGAITAIRNEVAYRRQMWVRAAQTYGVDLRMFGMPSRNIWDERVAFNIARNTIHTMQAKLARQMPLPSAQTVGADFIQRDRAKRFDRFLNGAFSVASYAKTYPQLLLDVLVFGTAAVNVYVQDGVVCIERLPIFDILVSEAEARYGLPRCLYHRYYIDRSVVMDLFGVDDSNLYGSKKDRISAIQSSPRPADDDSNYVNSGRYSDQILVYQATHLASGPDADDGQRVISLRTGSLQVQKWKRDKNYGAAFLRLQAQLTGFYGPSMAIELAAAQNEYDKLSEKIQAAHNLMGGSHIMVQTGTLSKTHIDNDIGTIIEYAGAPPTTFNPQPVHPDTYMYKDMIAQNMLRYQGISELAAQSVLPAGLRQASGKALSVYDDMEDARFRVAHEAVRQFHIDIGWLIVDACEEAEALGQSVEVLSPNQGYLERLNWKDVKMDRKEYILRCEPVSALSQTKASLFSEVLELVDRKVITDRQVVGRLLDIPDIEAERDLETADVDVIDKTVSLILRGKPYPDPDKRLKLDLAYDRARKFYNKARVDGVADERIAALDDYINKIESLLMQAQAEQQEQQAQAAAAQQPPQQEAPQAEAPAAPMEDPNV
jgi:hypothetical protein